VPLGVIGIVYEARPNVTFDVFSLCLKSANACLLKGGSDAAHSNAAIVSVIRRVVGRHGLDADIVHLLPPDRAATEALLGAVGYVDVIIPRGGQSLIDYVRNHSRVPVIETGAGIVHTYFDESGDLEKGMAIVHNAKTRRVSVCNALDCLLVHGRRLADLPALVAPLAKRRYACLPTRPPTGCCAKPTPPACSKKPGPSTSAPNSVAPNGRPHGGFARRSH
jgi:glutamate-5-semialdehyde dehydrogenase